MKKLLNILRYTLLSVVALITLIVISINIPWVQNYLVQRISHTFSEKLKTRVNVKEVQLGFFNKVVIKGVYLEDHERDTLLYAGKLQMNITDWLFISNKPVLKYIELQDAVVNMKRAYDTSAWNFDFITEAFASPKPEKEDTSKSSFEFDLKKVVLSNIRININDKWEGMQYIVYTKNLDLETKGINFTNRTIEVNNITLNKTIFKLNFFPGGRPKSPDTVESMINQTLNIDNWRVDFNKIILVNCEFVLNLDTLAPQPYFDPFHINITGINTLINDVQIVGDTIKGKMKHLTARDRSGIAIKNMQSIISVSPNASICKNLYLETNNSKVQNYFAMHYRWFPNFLQYNDSVIMEGHLRDAIVDVRDIAIFAPALKQLPAVILRGSADGKGSVAQLDGNIFNINDGINSLKGKVSLKGLPDIFKTKIVLENGEIRSSGKGILKYAQQLKTRTDINLDSIKYLNYNGNYNGYIENFFVKGIFTSNLGNITADIHFNMPGFNADSAKYEGVITTDTLQLGELLNQPELNNMTISETFSGNSFNPDYAQIQLAGSLQELTLKGYRYHNLITRGTLAKKQFSGFLSLDDPNLWLTFDGKLDYNNNNLKINAKALIRNCNLLALHLIHDSVEIDSVDFDLNCVGSNIDNFTGYAKLNNIDIKRNKHKLSLDTINIYSTGDYLNKQITINSNALDARIKGDFSLSKLPAAFQLYLSKYIPNYIKSPESAPPFQNVEFEVNTYQLDSLLAVTLPLIRGFDNSTISGNLNTLSQKLTLDVTVPYGVLGNFRLTNIAITGLGNLNYIALNTSIDNVNIGDSAINSTFSMTSLLSNDSLHFNLATSSPDTSSSITLDGQIVAQHDSLFLSLLPSEFYLNQTKWSVMDGCRAIYADQFLYIDGLKMTSGLQKISSNFQTSDKDGNILVTLENVDLGQLGNWAGMSFYQPDGRLNGTIKITNPLKNPYFNVNLKANNVKLGTETIGVINLIGDYDYYKKMVIIDPQTGIYNGNSSITASGNISFDININQPLNGEIQIKEAPLSLLTPFVPGIFSKITGNLDGKIKFGGRSYEPNIDGNVTLNNGGMKVDYIGCNYTLPSACIHINNGIIDFGKIIVHDEFNNTAQLTGSFSHRLFKDMKMNFNVSSKKLEILKLGKNDNVYFYGNVIAALDSFKITGPFNNIYLNGYNVTPVEKSHLTIPVSTTGDVGTYSYVSFKTYGKNIDKLVKINQNKINVSIDANPNNLATLTILLDPTNGDAIEAKGDGNIQFNMPANNEMRILGNYNIESGTYSYTFKQIYVKKQFNLNSGSNIIFTGPLAETTMDVLASYTVKTRLYDLLTDAEKASMIPVDVTDAKRLQPVNVLLHMTDHLLNPKLSFDLSLENRAMESNPAYTKLQQINLNERQKFDQVASLLITNNFIPSEGLLGASTVNSGLLNNVGQVLSGATSTQLTNLVTKMVGERQFNINVNYQNYYYNDPTLGTTNLSRNQVSTTLTKNYLNDRLSIEFGGKTDWGKQNSTNSNSSLAFTYDFRVQYQISALSHTRLTCFSTTDYDAALARDIVRDGVGVNWRKSFNSLNDFFAPSTNKKVEKETKPIEEKKVKTQN